MGMNIEELKQHASAGDAEAMCDLGMAYFHGEVPELKNLLNS